MPATYRKSAWSIAITCYFDQAYIDAFLAEARRRGKACQAAFAASDPAFREHALPLSTSYHARRAICYLAELWYYPRRASRPDAEPLVIDLQSTEAGYYHVPTYMAHEQGDLVFQVPRAA